MKKTTPEVRFPEFTGDWEKRKLIDSVKSIDTGKSKFKTDNSSGEYAILGSTSIIGYDDNYDYEGNFILTARVGANAGSLYRYTGKAKISDNTVFIQTDNNVSFIYYLLTQFNIKKLSLGTSQSLVKASELKSLDLMMPKTIEEQQQIGTYFQNLDTVITLCQRELDSYIKLKQVMLQKMFPTGNAAVPEVRFPEFTGDWEKRKLGDVVRVSQFKPYIAEPTENGQYEVIQQGNEPVIGYANGKPFNDFEPTVLFGDHTVSLYKPQKPFFVATDGVKILGTTENLDGYYFYSMLERYKPQPEGYKRHFTILKERECFYPTNKVEQQKIGSYFHRLDNLIALQQRELEGYKKLKQAMLQKRFV